MACNSSDINDPAKRNEYWIWWVDAKTGKGTWIPSSNETTVTDGNYTGFYFNGKVKRKGKLVNGKDIDTAICFNLEGNNIKYIIFKSDTFENYYISNGNYKDYYPNGKVMEEGIVANHKSGYKWKCYYPSGNEKWEEYTIDGIDLHLSFYENGNLKDSISYSGNKQNGRMKFWYENGAVQEITDWKMGVQDGIYHTFYQNGNDKELTNWINGKREGKSLTWYKNGQLESEKYNRDGKVNGIAAGWYEDGKVKFTCAFVDGKKEGVQNFYHRNGKLQSAAIYKNDLIEGEVKIFDTTGELIEIQKYSEGNLISSEKK
jgi:antitoxin component YwqK of YwqJK toxin-antitoxin module